MSDIVFNIPRPEPISMNATNKERIQHHDEVYAAWNRGIILVQEANCDFRTSKIDQDIHTITRKEVSKNIYMKLTADYLTIANDKYSPSIKTQIKLGVDLNKQKYSKKIKAIVESIFN